MGIITRNFANNLTTSGLLKPSAFNNDSFDNIKVLLKYVHGSPVINEISRVSKPGRRIYTRFDSLPRVQNGLGVAIISTSFGILTDNEAREKKVGGEIICNIS